MASRLRLGLLGLFIALWLGAPFVARHPLAVLVDPVPGADAGKSRLELALDRLDQELPEDVEVALWWPSRDAEGLGALGHLWAQGGYELAPRRVYPLLTPAEAAVIEPLDERMRPFLSRRARALAAGGIETGEVESGGTDDAVLVLAWGDEDCHLEDFPRLLPALEEGPLCLLRAPTRAGAEDRP